MTPAPSCCARLVMLAAQTALLEGKSIDNLASMQRLDGYLKSPPT